MEVESWFKGWSYYFEIWQGNADLLKFFGILILILIVIVVIKRVFNRIIYKFDILISGGGNKSNDRSEKRYDDIPYMYKKKNFFSKNEYDFFEIIEDMLELEFNGRYKIFPHVRLWDIIDIDEHQVNRWFATNKIARKHIDYVVVDKYNRYNPILAIELNGFSHNNSNTHKNDLFKKESLENAGIPLYFFRNKDLYNKNYIKDTIVSLIEKNQNNHN